MPNRAACYTKGLPRTQFGEVDAAAYDAMLDAIKSQRHDDFERIPRAAGRKLVDPQAAFAFHLEGGDPHTFPMPMPPAIRTQAAADEASELYWQALTRDVLFSDYATSSIVRDAAADLGVSLEAVFRGPTAGDKQGPYISQLLLKPIPFGSARIDQRWAVPVAGSDFMTTVSEWSQIQYGVPSWREATYEETRRTSATVATSLNTFITAPSVPAVPQCGADPHHHGPKSILNCNQVQER